MMPEKTPLVAQRKLLAMVKKRLDATDFAGFVDVLRDLEGIARWFSSLSRL